MTIPFERLKARLLANPKVKAEYDALAPEFEIAAELLRARQRAGLSQSNSPHKSAPASRPLLASKAARRFQAPRRCCGLPRRPAASSVSGSRPHRALPWHPIAQLERVQRSERQFARRERKDLESRSDSTETERAPVDQSIDGGSSNSRSPAATRASSSDIRASTPSQACGLSWRNSRMVGYHGVSARSRSQRQSSA